ncbi:MAG: enoyl-CoA hydratase/isomerase family protein [Thermodesulfobacteriota bacterium]
MKDVPYEEFVRGLEADPRVLVTVERPRPHTALVRLDDSHNHNALSGALTVQLKRALEGALADTTLRAVLLTARDPMFSVGGDWKLMRERAHDAGARAEGTVGIWKWIRYQFGGIARLVTQADKPVVVALNGPVAGVALAWTLSSDLVIASERAQLVPAFGRIGLVPEVGTNWALSRRLGHQKAFELFVRGGMIGARDALALGLVNEVVAHERLVDAALAWCDRIARLPEHVVTMTKPLLRNAADMSWHQTLLAEEFAEPNTFTTEAHRRAIDELLAKTTKAVDGAG